MKTTLLNTIISFLFGFCLVFFVCSVSAQTVPQMKMCKAVSVVYDLRPLNKWYSYALTEQGVPFSEHNQRVQEVNRFTLNEAKSVVAYCITEKEKSFNRHVGESLTD